MTTNTINLTDLEISELASEIEVLEAVNLSIAADTTLTVVNEDHAGEQKGEQKDEKM